MSKIIYIADFFIDQISGGAEICDDNLINMFLVRGEKVVKINTVEFNDKHFDTYKRAGFHFIVSNFINMSDMVKNYMINHPNSYSIMEHDHKYLKTRDPSKFDDFLAPSEYIINRSFYASAKNVFAQSKIHAEVIQKNLKIKNVINLGMSLWNDEQLQVITDNINNKKKDDFCILESNNPTKNTQFAINYCEKNNINYTLIPSMKYEDYICELSKHKTYLFFPKVLETFNRVLLEAKMLGCEVITTKLNGCLSEDWLSGKKGKELVDFVKSQREVVYDKIKNSIEEDTKEKSYSQSQSDITVILNAYRRPYNLKMQIDSIRNQTHPPKEIWLWVNSHEDNHGFDFKSLDVDKIFHNDFNWKFYGRFAAALLADTEYISIYDDDTVPGSRWHENCLDTMQVNEGILGSAGIILKSDSYVNHDRCGWPTKNEDITEVDLVGHAWFFKREWLRYLWQEKPVTWDNGEDIQFGFMAKIHGNIPTYCPPHPPSCPDLHGSVLGNELGIDSKATSTDSSISHKRFFSERDECVRMGIRKGWKTVNNIRES